MRYTDGMRFRLLLEERLSGQTPESVRQDLDKQLAFLEKNEPQTFSRMVGTVFKGSPDFEQEVVVDPWDLHGFNAYFNWVQPTIGFGQYSISVERKAKEVYVSASSEAMSVRWQRQALHEMIDRLFSYIPEDTDLDSVSGFTIPIPESVLEAEEKMNKELMQDANDDSILGADKGDTNVN